jgi:hypothetical protein
MKTARAGIKQVHAARQLQSARSTHNFFDQAPDDIIMLILSMLDVYDRFRAGATSRRMRRLFKSPAVWANVELNGVGYINTIVRRIFRVAGPGLQHLTIKSAELTDSTLALLVETSKAWPVNNLHTIKLGGPGSTMEQEYCHVVHNLRRVRKALPGLRLIDTQGTLVVNRESYACGLFELLSVLRDHGLLINTPKLKKEATLAPKPAR